MTNRQPNETVAQKLLRSRRTLEMQLEQGRASCDSQEALDRLKDLEKNDTPDDSLIPRGRA